MNHLPVDVAIRYLHSEDGDGDRMRALLSAEELQRVEAFAGPKRRREFVLGRAAARLLLSERLDVAPAEVALRVAESGVVEVAAGGLYLSISHSGDWAVAAASPRRIGVDIERIAPRFPELEQYMLHPDEPPLTDVLPLDRERANILCWTLKEATLKAMHRGLGYSPKKLRLDVDFEGGRATVQDADGRLWEAWFEERDGYYAAVSVAS